MEHLVRKRKYSLMTKSVQSISCSIGQREKDLLKVVKTKDGSATIYHPIIGEHYHSYHGAFQESQHVFLSSGLKYFLGREAKEVGKKVDKVSVLELGFGTGLNYLLTADFCFRNKIALDYTGIERYPLSPKIISRLGYKSEIDNEVADNFHSRYSQIWADNDLSDIQIQHNSFLTISICDAMDFQSTKTFDILYFDAFSAIHQPEMWTIELLAHLSSFLKAGGIFVTYAITGNLKRNLLSLGFQIEKVPGAPGKREMLRATYQR